MSFEMKYDVNGIPLKTNVEPVAPVEVVEQEQRVVEVMAENQPETEPELVENQPEVVPEVATPVEKPSAAQESWKALRQQKELAEKRALEAEKRLQESQKQPNQQAADEEDLSLNLGEDDFAEGKHLSKVDKKIQRLENQLKQYQEQSALSATEARLKAQFPDFDRILSVENMDNLQAAYPEIANTINSSNDLYSKAVTAYTMIKKLGIAPQEDVFSNDRALAQRNAAKPKPLASISPQQGDSPLSKANAFANGTLTDDLKKSLWKEMNEYRK